MSSSGLPSKSDLQGVVHYLLIYHLCSTLSDEVLLFLVSDNTVCAVPMYCFRNTVHFRRNVFPWYDKYT